MEVVKAINKMHDEQLLFDSEANKGTTVKIIFKKGKDHYSDKEFIDFVSMTYNLDAARANMSNQPFMKDTSKFTILIVEDNVESSSYIATLLSPTYRTLEAINGSEGLELCNSHWPDLVTRAIIMPDMNGIWMLLNSIEPHTTYIPTIIMSTSTTDFDS